LNNQTSDIQNKKSNNSLNPLKILNDSAFKPTKTFNKNITLDNIKKEHNNHDAEFSKHNITNTVIFSIDLSQNIKKIPKINHDLKNFTKINQNKTSLNPHIKTNNSNYNQVNISDNKNNNINNKNQSNFKYNKTHLVEEVAINKTILKAVIINFINETHKDNPKITIISPKIINNKTNFVAEQVVNKTITKAVKIEINKLKNETHKDNPEVILMSPKILINMTNDVEEKILKPKEETSNSIKQDDKEINDNSLNDIGKKDDSEINQDIFSFPTITRFFSRILSFIGF